MNKTNDLIVLAYFDVLGSENKLYELGLRQYLKIYERLRRIVLKERGRFVIDASVPEKINEDGSVECPVAMGIIDVDYDYFSDSIVFWSKFDYRRFRLFCDICAEFFCEIMNLGIPLRGGITCGEAFMDKNKKIYVGQPLIEAVRVENSQDWIGVSFGPSFDSKPYKYFFLNPKTMLFYKLHTKPGFSQFIPGFVLDWPNKWNEMFKKPILKQINEMNIDNKYLRYYDNTASFIKYSLNYRDEGIERLYEYIKS
jgi:hypothetical protein